MKAILIVFTLILCALMVVNPVSAGFFHRDEQPLGFVFFGDSGRGNSKQREVAQGIRSFCARELCEFVTLLGDNFYPDGVQSVDDPQWKTKFQDPYQSLGLVFWAALGNHDHYGNIQAQLDYAHKVSNWKMPSRYYSFRKKMADFFVLDTEVWDQEQLTWLERELKRSLADWRIVYGHHPIISYGAHGSTSYLKDLRILLEKYGVDFYLAGHDHDRQYFSFGKRPEYAVSGAASETRPVDSGTGTLYASSALGFGHLKISGDKALVRFLDKNGEEDFRREVKQPKTLFR